MYIKQIIIHGFKSFKEQIIVETFDKGLNVVVGRNGSGKTIQFVLSDEFSNLRPEQRQALLHEGMGPRVVTAYVEIIFDNADNRLPIERDEITLRRVIGAKKDQYFLNKKMVQRLEVTNLLESAGFSHSNPYYIVKQGKVSEMTTVPDSDRLKLLKEVAGTRIYDERKDEAISILRDTQAKLEKIDEFINMIEEKFLTLEEEKEELREYQTWDKKRRALEFYIYDRELKEIKKKHDKLNISIKSFDEKQTQFVFKLKDATDQIKKVAKCLRDVKREVNTVIEEKEALSLEYQELMKQKMKLKLIIKDLTEEVDGDNKSKKQALNELKKLQNSIKKKEDELLNIKPKYENLKRKEEECSRVLVLKEHKQKHLYAKQGRGSQFLSKEARNEWIQNELKSLKKQLENKIDHKEKLVNDIQHYEKRHHELELKIKANLVELEKQRAAIDSYNTNFYKFKNSKNQLQSFKNELWRQQNALQHNLSSVKEELAKSDQALRNIAGKAILNGRDSIKKVLDVFKQRGGAYLDDASQYYGQVIENVKCDKNIQTAVEVTAGGRLFFHIVESDRISTQILKEMNHQNLPGEVTFMPLNRLTIRDMRYPQSKDAIPMVNKLKYEPHLDRAMRFVFGKTLICRNLEVAIMIAKQNTFDCITIDGDKVSSKGTLSGGYFKNEKSKLEIQNQRNHLLLQIKTIEDELTGLKFQLNETDTNSNIIMSDMQKIETKMSQSRSNIDNLKADINLLKGELGVIQSCQASNEKLLVQASSNLESMLIVKNELETELHQELLTQLSINDQKEIDMLNDEIKSLRQERESNFALLVKFEADKNKLENLLNNNLIKRRDELKQAMQEISYEDRKRTLNNSQLEFESVTRTLETLNINIKNNDERLQDYMKKLNIYQTDLDTWKIAERDAQEKLENESQNLVTELSKQNALKKKMTDCQAKISDFGPFPNAELMNIYSDYSSKNLFKELENVNSNMKRFKNVNKKAFDQFVCFSEQKEKLITRKQELDRGYIKIKELMNVLEQKKCEAILFTYRQVSMYFTEVFKKLVPNGFAQLVMKSANENNSTTSSSENENNIDSYTGIMIKVSFDDHGTEMCEMKQLSGGQKSLIAMAFIFAIQKCDPAPFYLFDEIDHALDPQHRTAIANMIHEFSDHAQFIVSTFRPELLLYANKFYGVKFRNKVSHIDSITRDIAYDFVEDDESHG
ncbi:structural maintenance of chromosomes protein 3-like isoform X2 [Daktulosphaira vitifoliae]|uniref:structural maintenance of chromosomes protein 3-like isoform X2 n=1 Tax=Daktulosphaira vitifoliae TaxID=58002 RepID=UPI0021A98772|nr:structural maintenance of chromosomes protein 3-like isoform X2 [Daktulosphaira vitifoliae]